MTADLLMFWLFALASCGGAIGVVLSQRVVRMAFWLVVSLGSVAGLFFLLNADFVAATQLLIYVGGTVVLLIFGVMLTASGSQMQLKTSPAEGFLAAGVGSLFLLMIFFAVSDTDWNKAHVLTSQDKLAKLDPNDREILELRYLEQLSTEEIASVLMLEDEDEVEIRVRSALERFNRSEGYNKGEEGNTLRPIGLKLLGLSLEDLGSKPDSKPSSGYLLPFEIVSVHLLVVLIGAAYLARAKRASRSGSEPIPEDG